MVKFKVTVKMAEGVEIAVEADTQWEAVEAAKQLSMLLIPAKQPMPIAPAVGLAASTVSPPRTDGAATRAARGENREYVFQVLLENKGHGLSQAEVMKRLASQGRALAVSSVRHALNQLSERRMVSRRGDKWHALMQAAA